ncbi:hypothetical protein D7D52_32350 [Nocardia yunnanensis]|uniref:SUKH-4 immunity protein of toxin-antitoxin system n=1 Tax=Nocardia yunnanensis TaxID=2382165 RepID=A0A386ZJY6_9NOCA|nr:SUKH-4 family immunity protein [Nocardia yunnanensis]AYF77728.1 hypothetical protein D7D52_32350 [Nocardia yunnanensis]
MIPVSCSIDRTTLESVFTPDRLVTLPADALTAVTHQPTKRFLRDVGIPTQFWLDAEPGLSTGQLDCDNQDLAELYPEYRADYSNWALLGSISNDPIYLDVTNGTVFSIPDGGTPAPLNTTIDAFCYFLYVLELERPNYDFEILGPDDTYQPGAETRLRELMIRCDPTGFEPPDPCTEFEPGVPTWELALQFVADKLQ